ncbi:MAG: ATP-binding protein [Clostridia bacterium]|nr:ATP-binding protein [Clostridia bacterium]
MTKTMVILMGLQGSGKSTFYHRYLQDDFVRVNLDTLKTRRQESRLIAYCIAEGKCFAVDNTNPTRADRQRYIQPAKAAGYRIVGCFMESKLRACIERNEQRTGKAKVPATAIAATSNKLQIPNYEEGFDELYFVKNGGQTMTVEKWRE